MNIDFSRPQIGIELNRNMALHTDLSRPLLDAGATFAMVREEGLMPDDAGNISAMGLAMQIPTYIWGAQEWWSDSLYGFLAGMISPYSRPTTFYPHDIQQAVDDENKSLADMRRVVSGSMIGRFVASVESISAGKGIETDFWVLARRGRRSSELLAPETGLMASMIAISELPTLVYGTETGESASIAMESGARGVIISSQSLSAELVSEVKNSLGG